MRSLQSHIRIAAGGDQTQRTTVVTSPRFVMLSLYFSLRFRILAGAPMAAGCCLPDTHDTNDNTTRTRISHVSRACATTAHSNRCGGSLLPLLHLSPSPVWTPSANSASQPMACPFVVEALVPTVQTYAWGKRGDAPSLVAELGFASGAIAAIDPSTTYAEVRPRLLRERRTTIHPRTHFLFSCSPLAALDGHTSKGPRPAPRRRR
jgi:hypothetical protein